jgi:hypothetical protein
VRSPVDIASLAIQCLLLTFGSSRWMPKTQPDIIQFLFVAGSAVTSLVCTTINFSIGPGALPFSSTVFLVGLVALAIASPVAGLAEARLRTNTQVYVTSRFPGHLISNILGALAAAAFVFGARQTPGFDEFAAEFKDIAAFNIVLPMTVIVILAFVRVQQVDKCSGIDQKIDDYNAQRRDLTKPERKQLRRDIDECIMGYSLKHPHQFLNVVFLIGAVFAAATMVLYLFAYTMKQDKLRAPLSFSWQMGAAIILLLLFLCACGFPAAWRALTELWRARGLTTSDHLPDDSHEGNASTGMRAVELTFLTGTPAVLVFVLIWFTLLKADVGRNIAAASIIGVGYLVYTALAVLGSRRSARDAVRLHYFSAAAFAFVLIVIAGAFYYS